MSIYDFTVKAQDGGEVSLSDYKNNSKIKWNFTKFLIDRSGEIVARFEPTAAMKDVKAKVEEIL